MIEAVPSNAAVATPSAATPLATVVYHSRAAVPLSAGDLYQLTAAAQARNRAESITGVMLYEDRRFFQWLEGPPESVDRIMRSIRSDPRHTDIEVVDSRPLRARVFGDWTMKCATREPTANAWRDEILEPPPEIVEGLRRRPDAAPVLLVKLVAVRPEGADVTGSEVTTPVPHAGSQRASAAVLQGVFFSAVVPALLERHPLATPPTKIRLPHAQAAELATLLVASNQAPARRLIERLCAIEDSVWPLYATLIEPTARILGDRWDSDECSAFDVALALSRLRATVRHLSAEEPLSFAVAGDEPVVLIAPEPGEPHGLGAALDSEVLWHAGWNPHCEFPATDRALQDLLAANWFDALDLSLSIAFRREDTLPRVTKTIALARAASRNPALAVIVGGRLFVEQTTAGGTVGADVACTTALDIEQAIGRGMKRRARMPH